MNNISKFLAGLTFGTLGLIAIDNTINYSARHNTPAVSAVSAAQTYETQTSPRINVSVRETQNTPAANNLGQKNANSLENFARYTAKFEGKRPKVYDPNPNDKKPEPTIGVGHYMDRGNSRQTFARVLPEVNWDNAYNGRIALTNPQMERLFADDIKEYVAIAKRLIPKFDEFPFDVQEVLVDKAYRGDLGGSPKARKLWNSGSYKEAAIEFLNRKDYENAERNGMLGVKRRLDAHDFVLRTYANKK